MLLRHNKELPSFQVNILFTHLTSSQDSLVDRGPKKYTLLLSQLEGDKGFFPQEIKCSLSKKVTKLFGILKLGGRVSTCLSCLHAPDNIFFFIPFRLTSRNVELFLFSAIEQGADSKN